MRYVKTLAAAGIALALTGGAVLAQGGDAGRDGSVEAAGPETRPVDDTVDQHRSAAPTRATTTTTSTPGHGGGTTIAPTRTPESGDGPVAFGDVHDVVRAGDGGAAPAGADPDAPIGGVGDSAAPEGIGLTSFPGNAPAKTPHAGPGSYSVGPGCHVQCITSGVAYPRGFGAELVVKTSVDADIFVSVIADTDGDGDYDFSEFTWSDGAVDDFRWTLDHLDPGQTYYAMAAATDDNDKTAHAFGEFTTLSQRDIYVSLGDVAVTGGPDNIVETDLWMKVDGTSSNFTPGEAGIPIYNDMDRFLDLRLLVVRSWDGDVCEAWQLNEDGPSHGHWSDSCLAWHHASVDDLDLDTAPAGKTRWTQTVASTTISTPTGGGGALPPGYGDPYYFSFSAPVTISVTYR
ncbi:hypothetical protein [Actinospongicola halichondriae]|uniref:hypothetical protein n=1 Tax=Actinospongicola halichondriae TaxID=3236844 RepID=UPI003D40F404